MIRLKQVSGGRRNVTYQITGELGQELAFGELDLKEKDIKLVSLLWVIQEKLGIILSWDKETPILPMESRNSVRLDVGLTPPEGWGGVIYLSSFNFSVPPTASWKHFFIVLDFDR
jgi:hypothetical protein